MELELVKLLTGASAKATSSTKVRNAVITVGASLGVLMSVTTANALDPAFPDAPQMLRLAQTAPDPQVPDALPPIPAKKKPPVPPVKPVAKVPATPGAVSANPAKPTAKVANSAAAKVSPEAKRAISVAALTGQDVVPEHHHVAIDVPPTDCPGNPDAIGISRIIKVDTHGGFYAGQTYHTKMPLLGPREVILTFDDGPFPGRTDRVLAALKHECTHATFFMVGQMAKAYPAVARKVAEEGNTIAYHTMTHSYKLAHGPFDQSQMEISSGWRVVDQAVYGKAGDKPMTHFFRYPGLFNNRVINQWFNTLNMGVFAVDAVGNDWLKGHLTTVEAPNVMNEALAELEHNNGGILLLHDIKESSSNAVAPLLVELKKRGFKIVHIEPLIPPPPVATGPVAPGEIDASPAPLSERTVDGFDPARQIVQQNLGRVGQPSTNPAPLPAYQLPAKPVAKPAPASTDGQPATQSIQPVGSAAPMGQAPAASSQPIPAPVPVQAPQSNDDGFFSSTAKTFKGIGAAVGLW